MDNKKILEALKMQPLSEEEKAARHILGRLYGPIATCKESTRNGRLYNRTLWEKALRDEIFNEKVATKALFLELGHPADREETDMTKVCACIPEVPKIVGDDLYAYVDILDTANGKVLKTLCDYGFVPGISSRGSGDVMPNDEVDPETFFLETWDIVQLPAVKKARLSVCESLDRKNIKLRKALVESLNEANEEDKAIMKETLDNLDIDIEGVDEAILPGGTSTDIEEIPMSMIDEDPAILIEEADEESEDESTNETEVEEPVEEPSFEEAEETTEEESAEEAEEPTGMTVGQFLDELKDLDTEMPITINSVEIDGKIYETDLEFDVQESGLFVNVSCVPSEEETEEESTEEIETEETEEPVEETESEDAENEETEEAVDDGDDEVVESMKELVRKNGALEEENKTLKRAAVKAKSVSDAKEKELTEEIEKYKSSFARVSAVASRNKKSVAELQEQLTEKDTKISQLNESLEKALTESATKNEEKIKRLQESLSETQTESTATIKALREDLNKQIKLASDNAKIAKAYKAKLSEAVNKYISFRASMLGVKPSEITCQLNEGYTFADIDMACENVLTNSVGMTRLPISSGKVTTRITESKQTTKKSTPKNEWSYDIDDSLLELAGLK
ncbi:MAG: hypothetical protein J6A25_00435 [Lachnospiraceae bacterium]|nr:hypothetical protein [Lachnospiraceae bacterium]